LTALSEYNSKGSGVLNDGGGGSYRKLAGSIGVLLAQAVRSSAQAVRGGRGNSGGVGDGGNTLAQQAAGMAYGQLAAIQFKGDGVTDFDRQKYADGQARQQQMDAWGMDKDAHRQGMEVQQYQDGAPQRALDKQTAQVMNEAINPNTQPERRAELLNTLNQANGKGGVHIKAIDLPDQLAPDGNTKMKGGQVLVAIHPDGRVQQVNPQQGQGGAAVGSTSTVNGKTAVWDGAKWVPRS
jgi:hypothetical protein